MMLRLLIMALILTVGACAKEAGSSDKDGAQTDTSADVAQDSATDTPPQDVETPEDAAPDTFEEVWPPVKGETEWLSNDDGEAAGGLQYDPPAENYYEKARFDIEEPIRIWGLKAMFYIPKAATVTLYLWDDYSGNFFNFDHWNPLATFKRELVPEDQGVWQDFELEEPVELVPGRMFYAGVIVDGEDGFRLMVDGAPLTEGGDGKNSLHSLIWQSKVPPDEGGFPSISGSPGDFMVRVEIEKIHLVDEADRDFEKVPADELGIPGFSRAAFADVDGDGDIDVMVGGPSLFLNDGTGKFEGAVGWLDGIGGHNGGVFGDYDNDGDPDYFATGHQGGERLLRNDGDHFTDVTAESGIDDSQLFNCNGEEGVLPVPTEAAAWLDYNNDGWLDIYQSNFICWEAPAVAGKDILWRNNGDGTFTDVTTAAGMSKGQTPGKAGRGVATADANGDGVVDVMVANYRLHKNLYFESQGPGLYKSRGYDTGLEGSGASSGYYGHTIGAVFGDVDHDGDLDLFHTNLAHPRFIDFSDKATLFINDGQAESSWTDVTEEIGIRYLETPSNPNLFDFDNDGDLDIFYTCTYGDRVSQLYRNDGHPSWTEVNYSSGSTVYGGWGSIVGDIDGDGDMDLLAGGQYFRNRNVKGHGSILVDVEGLGAGKTNRDGVGVRVEAMVDGLLVMRERVGGHGTGVQDSPTLHLGLGNVTSADLTVRFPASGTVIEVKNVPAGAHIRVVEDGSVTGLE